MPEILRGRVWKFGDDINTDLLIPGHALSLPPNEQARYCFAANRPGWVDLVRQGDVIVAGKNFGTGSSRPGARVLRQLGIACLLAESVNGLFLRGCVNFALPALSCPGVFAAFEEEHTAEISPREGRIVNLDTGQALETKPLPEMLLRIIDAGGILPLLRAEGYLE